jgi:antitoxin CptB
MLCSHRKKLIFRSWHRGTREADLLMGRFADSYIPQCSEEDLKLYEILLDEADPDIYDWLIERTPCPDTSFAPILKSMITFYRIKND